MSWPNKEDCEALSKLSKETFLALFFLQIKNLWRVDGLYFLGIEENVDTETATRIDARCWRTMGKLEARQLKKTLGIKETDVIALIETLRHTSWALYQTEKESKASAEKGTFQVTRCRTQETRLNRGLGEFPCRNVRLGYLESFTEEFNSEIHVNCKSCPPDRLADDVWCTWEFTLRK